MVSLPLLQENPALIGARRQTLASDAAATPSRTGLGNQRQYVATQ